MPLYTFVLEFDGGTYIEQVRSKNLRSALRKWAKVFPKTDVAHKPSNRKRLAAALLEDEPISISGVRNVWCASASVQCKLALLNIVKTSN